MSEANYKRLIVLCCHAVFTGDEDDIGEEHWLLQPFQRSNPTIGKPSEHKTFMTHIAAAGLACKSDPGSLLVISGGRTTDFDRSEAEGYEASSFTLLHKFALGKPIPLEENATDSYQNLLFSILEFRRTTGSYPESITVITHAFKERRFLELHARAIKWPLARIRVQGINPPFTLEELQQAEEGEREHAYDAFASDPYGVRPPLADKRRARNWKSSVVGGLCADLEPVIRELLLWTGGKTGREIFPGRLPWEEA